MTKAENIRNQCMKILDKYDADYRGVTVDKIDGTTYVIFKYYGGTNDTIDRNDDSWDEMSELDGVVDVGYGVGYGIEGKYEDSLLIELDEDIVESKKSARKSIKESEYEDYVNLDNLHFGYNDEYGFMEFKFYKNIQIKHDNGYTIIFGQLPSKEWAFAITDVSKGEGNLIDCIVNFVKKDTLVDLNNALKNLGIDKTWNELSESKKSARKSLKESTKKDILKEVAKLIRNILKEGGYDNARVQIYQDLSVECLVWGNREIRNYVISELEKYPNFKFNGEYEDDYVWEDGGYTIYLTIL